MSHEPMRDRLRQVLTDNGVDTEGGIHSWRCFETDRFPGYCRCVDELLDELVAAACPAHGPLSDDGGCAGCVAEDRAEHQEQEGRR